MPSEKHMSRQFEWKQKLQKYGCNVSLEKPLNIKGAKVVVDVFAQIEGKTFLIEIGNVNDDRKQALLKLYSEKPYVYFVHEEYGQNKMPSVLEYIQVYRNSPEYKVLVEERREAERRFDERMKQYKMGKTISLILWLFVCFLISVSGISSYELYVVMFWFLVLWIFGSVAIWIFFPLSSD